MGELAEIGTYAEELSGFLALRLKERWNFQHAVDQLDRIIDSVTSVSQKREREAARKKWHERLETELRQCQQEQRRAEAGHKAAVEAASKTQYESVGAEYELLKKAMMEIRENLVLQRQKAEATADEKRQKEIDLLKKRNETRAKAKALDNSLKEKTN